MSFVAVFQGFLPPMLVFVQSIERARELFHELVYEGINVDVIHAERTQQQVRVNTRRAPRSVFIPKCDVRLFPLLCPRGRMW